MKVLYPQVQKGVENGLNCGQVFLVTRCLPFFFCFEKADSYIVNVKIIFLIIDKFKHKISYLQYNYYVYYKFYKKKQEIRGF